MLTSTAKTPPSASRSCPLSLPRFPSTSPSSSPAPAASWASVAGTFLQLPLPNCDMDVLGNTVGAPCLSTAKSAASCAAISADTPFMTGYCVNAADNSFSYRAQCHATPCCSTSGWVVTLAVLLSLAAVGLCAFWGWKDRKAKANAKAEAAALAASVDAEKARAAAVTGFNFGGSGAAAPTVHSGYTAMH